MPKICLNLLYFKISEFSGRYIVLSRVIVLIKYNSLASLEIFYGFQCQNLSSFSVLGLLRGSKDPYMTP